MTRRVWPARARPCTRRAWPSSPPAPPRRRSQRARGSGDPCGGADHRLPRGARRSGQTLHPACTPASGRHPQTRAPGRTRRARHRAVRPGGGQPVSVPARPSPPGASGTTASSRSTSVDRRWCAPLPEPPVAVVVDPLGYDGVLAARALRRIQPLRTKSGWHPWPFGTRRIRRNRGELDGRHPGAG